MSSPPASPEQSVAAEGAELLPGYRVMEHMRRGADLDVYEVWSEERACPCVLKTLRADRVGGTGAERLIREGELLLELTHPHLVRAYEVHRGALPGVVLETLDGATVSRLIADRARRLPAVDLAHLGLQLCSALGYLHRRGILHLDLKPSNVISDMGHVKVIDLSLAREPGKVPAGMGTLQYRAPEQARGEMVGPATDVWGLGGVLYAAATSRRPFPDGDQLQRRPDPVCSLRRLPRPFADVVDACFEPRPEDRPLLEDLAARCQDVAGNA